MTTRKAFGLYNNGPIVTQRSPISYIPDSRIMHQTKAKTSSLRTIYRLLFKYVTQINHPRYPNSRSRTPELVILGVLEGSTTVFVGYRSVV
ncbi:hypothetical protein L218DRAFT_557395 [Marasmius fiardii PR-910]|nr:hypothetical protein L218DRAFT_557395 [Marasmius fiardii PR-910]